MDLLEILARDFEALIEMPDAALSGLINLPPYFCCFPPIRGEMQLGPRLGPSCDPLFKFRLGRYTAGRMPELLCFAHRS